MPYTISALVEPNFSTEPTGGGGSAPGRRSDNDTLRTGTQEEQDALQYPFKILQLSEYISGDMAAAPSARQSALDMGEEMSSF